jgi:hypothetical protein
VLLLRAFKEEEVHLFRSRRSLGHAAVNQFARGWRRLDEETLDTFLTKSTVHGDFLQEIRRRAEVDGGADTEIQMRSDSPAESIPSSDLTDEGFRALSTSSVWSASSNGEPVDPNEPEDDGEDLSDAQLTSGPGLGMVVDAESGLLVDADDEGEEDESGDEVEDVDEELDVELQTEDEDSEDEF